MDGISRMLAEKGIRFSRILSERLSDLHNGGQCAVLFEWNAAKYVFKPRSSRTDVAWADFLDALEPILNIPLPRAVRPLEPLSDTYTVVPFLENREAESMEEIRRYYARAGALLALAMVFGSVDMHSENLVADKDAPCLVDLETLFSGVTPDRFERDASLYDSLLFSHFLPNWMLEDGENRDLGALSAPGKNQPRLHGAPCPASAHVDTIAAGFRLAFDALDQNRALVQRELSRFADAPFRKLLRPTDVYARLIGQIAGIPEDAKKRACAERLRRAYLLGGAAWAERMSRVADSEIRAVLRGDIPYFFCYGGERCLRDNEGIVAEEFFAQSPLEAARCRLNALAPQDGVDQERVILQSLACVCREIAPAPVSSAREVFDLLEQRAIESAPSSWLGLTRDARGWACFQSVGFDLYDGLLGILCFYAALYEATGDLEARAALLKRYRPYRERVVLHGRTIVADSANVSLTSGLGGHLLALGYFARCLNDDAFLEDAATLFSRFSFDSFHDFAIWDVYGGAAGLLLALPHLSGLGLDAEIQKTARLLAQGVRGARVSLTGLAHGAAGLALALAAAQFVGGGDFAEDILRLLDWEGALYDETAQNWPDLRDPDARGFMRGLCSGAPGIGLARAQMLFYTRDARVRAACERDLARVRAHLRSSSPSFKRDCLCCGSAARIEAERTLLGRASSALNDPPVLLHELETNDFPAGLFQGWAGVGYALSRALPGAKSSLFLREAGQ